MAARHDKVFMKGGEFLVLESKCFIETICDSSNDIELWADHDSKRKIASRSDGLEFANCLQGLLFRMPLDNPTYARTISDFLEDGDKASVSVGCHLDETRVEDVGGHRVTFVSKVSLMEISLCREGAVPNTFASIVDLSMEEPVLWLAGRSLGFKVDNLIANTASRTRKQIDAVEALSKKIDRVTVGDAQDNEATPVAPRFSYAQVNQWQTAETERLQQEARARLI
jgi:hypothetical protein